MYMCAHNVTVMNNVLKRSEQVQDFIIFCIEYQINSHTYILGGHFMKDFSVSHSVEAENETAIFDNRNFIPFFFFSKYSVGSFSMTFN